MRGIFVSFFNLRISVASNACTSHLPWFRTHSDSHILTYLFACFAVLTCCISVALGRSKLPDCCNHGNSEALHGGRHWHPPARCHLGPQLQERRKRPLQSHPCGRQHSLFQRAGGWHCCQREWRSTWQVPAWGRCVQVLALRGATIDIHTWAGWVWFFPTCLCMHACTKTFTRAVSSIRQLPLCKINWPWHSFWSPDDAAQKNAAPGVEEHIDQNCAMSHLKFLHSLSLTTEVPRTCDLVQKWPSAEQTWLLIGNFFTCSSFDWIWCLFFHNCPVKLECSALSLSIPWLTTKKHMNSSNWAWVCHLSEIRDISFVYFWKTN